MVDPVYGISWEARARENSSRDQYFDPDLLWPNVYLIKFVSFIVHRLLPFIFIGLKSNTQLVLSIRLCFPSL